MAQAVKTDHNYLTAWTDDKVKKKLGVLVGVGGTGEGQKEGMKGEGEREGGNISGQMPALPLMTPVNVCFVIVFIL